MLMKVSLYQSWDLLVQERTTLLNVLSSIDYMTKGSITINGKQLESYLISNYLILEKKILDLFFKIIIF